MQTIGIFGRPTITDFAVTKDLLDVPEGLLHLGSGDIDAVNQSERVVDIDMHLHTEVPLAAFRGQGAFPGRCSPGACSLLRTAPFPMRAAPGNVGNLEWLFRPANDPASNLRTGA